MLAPRAALLAALALSPTACSSSTDAAPTSPLSTDDAGPRCVRPERATAIPDTCNGSADLCGRRFDQVTFPMTHNAMSNADDGWVVPNQDHGIARQLADGVRGMMLDTHYFDPDTRGTDKRRDDLAPVDQAYLCHALCLIGRRPLLDGLCDIVSWLDLHRGDVVSIIFEDYVSPEDTEAVMRESGLYEYVHRHELGTPWPTLRELVDKNERVIVFAESGKGTLNWYHPAWKHIWDTPYTFASVDDFTCDLNRGAQTNALFLVNHWIQNPASDPKFAAVANAEPVLLGRAQDCTTSAGRTPTFIGVDFYDLGALFPTVAAMNAK